MYRFLLSPRWLAFHLLVVLGIVVMVNLGFWQLRRLDERQALNAAVASRVDLAPAPLDDVLVAGRRSGRRRVAAGHGVGDVPARRAFIVVNRSQGGIAGSLVVTPLELDDGRILLVDRGLRAARRRPAGRRPAGPSPSRVGCGRRRSAAPASSATPRRVT